MGRTWDPTKINPIHVVARLYNPLYINELCIIYKIFTKTLWRFIIFILRRRLYEENSKEKQFIW